MTSPLTSKSLRHHRPSGRERLPERHAAFMAVKPRDFGTAEDIARQAFDEAGGVKLVAAFFGLSVPQTYALTDADLRGQLTLDQALRLSQFRGVKVIAEALAAAAGGSFIPPDDYAGPGLSRLSTMTNKEMAAYIAALVDAHQDGVVDRQEAIGLLRDVVPMIRHLIAIRNMLNDVVVKSEAP